MIIDGKNMVLRNFHAFPIELSANGRSTNLIHGSFLELIRHVDMYQAKNIVICWDNKSSFRRTIYEGYKSKRKSSMMESTYNAYMDQMELFRDGLNLLPVYQIECDEVEGDDLVALSILSLTEPFMIISTDRDFWQLIQSDVSVFNPVTKKLFTYSNFKEQTGFPRPLVYLAYKCLKGDSGDGVPSAWPRLKEVDAIAYATEMADTWTYKIERLKFPRRPEIEDQINRNYELVGLYYAVYRQRDLLRRLDGIFDQRPVPKWSEFMKYCQTWKLAEVLGQLPLMQRVFE